MSETAQRGKTVSLEELREQISLQLAASGIDHSTSFCGDILLVQIGDTTYRTVEAEDGIALDPIQSLTATSTRTT